MLAALTGDPLVPFVSAVALFLLVLFLLVSAMTATCFMMIRASRRLRREGARRRARPTPVPDIWSMHRLADEDADR